MPLLDHFHPSLLGTRHRESFHPLWAASLAERLNGDLLPSGFFAEIQVHIGGRVEVDVGTFEAEESARLFGPAGVATLEATSRVWTPPAMAEEPPLYATAYRAVRRLEGDSVDARRSGFDVGQALPTLPLALRGGPTLPVELEVTYAEVCRKDRIG